MAAGNWTFYNDFKEHLAKADVDCNADTFKCVLMTSGYTPSATHSTLSDLTNICADSDYSAQTLANIAVTETGGTVKFDADDISFGSSVSITAKYAAIYDDTHASDALMCYVDLDTGGGSVSSTNSTFQLTLSANGVWQLSG
jgi:hypothetical protein|tara:strand:- start:2704 stop:3129 length:426 start_codon:yes stop_codon:yes gene_type:complete